MPRTIKLTLSYDGTDFAGWQLQPRQRTVQGILEETLARITGQFARVSASGRTDAGVHALAQVVSFDTESMLSTDVLFRALNGELPRDAAVSSIEDAAPEFHARRDASRKRYRYLIYDGPVRDVFLLRYSWHLFQRLDADAMHRAAQALVGTHDFASYQTSGSKRKTTVRTVFELDVRRRAGGLFLPLRLGEGRGEGAESSAKPVLHADVLQFARELRRRQSDAESLLWLLLRDGRLGGFKFRRQHPLGPYFLDFYCHDARLAIELDGGQHNTDQGRQHDLRRTQLLNEHGIRVLRFWNHDVLGDTGTVLEAVWNSLHEGTLTPALSQRERESVVVLEIEADGFLYNMVRNIVGTLVEVGQGEQAELWPGEVLAARDRRRAGVTAPPQGLYLVNVSY